RSAAADEGRGSDADLPPAARDLPGRRSRRLRDERVGEIRVPQRYPGARHIPDRLGGDLARPGRVVAGRDRRETGNSCCAAKRRFAERDGKRETIRRGTGAVIRYVARRLLLAVPTLFGIVILVFLLLHLAPGSPVTALGGESGRRVSGRAAAEMRRLYGLDRPLPERFVKWIGRVARLDLGESFVDRRPVSRRIAEALPYTLELNGLAL